MGPPGIVCMPGKRAPDSWIFQLAHKKKAGRAATSARTNLLEGSLFRGGIFSPRIFSTSGFSFVGSGST